MNQNDRIRNLKEQNYNTDPVNIPPWVNPFLRLSDNEVLNKLLNKPGSATTSASARFAPSSEFISSSTQPSGTLPGLVPTAEPVLARPGAGRPATHPDVTTPHNGTPSVPTPEGTTVPLSDGAPDPDEEDGESGDEGAHGGRNPQDDMNLDEGMDDEGHSEIVPAQATTTNGSTVSSGPGLIVDGKINRALGLPQSLRTQLTTSNGKPLKRIMYNPSTGKYTLFYGTRLASGRYPGKVELSAPPPPTQTPTWYEAAGLAYYQATLDPRSGANYLQDQIAGPGAHRNRYQPP